MYRTFLTSFQKILWVYILCLISFNDFFLKDDIEKIALSEIERIRPFEKRYEQLKMEEQELRSVHSTNMAKKDSEIQALKEAYVREQYDSQEREKQLRDSIDKQKELYSGVMRDLNAVSVCYRGSIFIYVY